MSSTSKILAALAASAMVGMFAAPAFADPIPQEEAEQFGNSAKPDVDAGASQGPDAPIVNQEQNQMGNDPATDFGAGDQAPGGPSIENQEKEGIED